MIIVNTISSLLADANVRTVLLSTFLLNSAAALIGTFAYLQKRSLTGDAVSHAILPGICFAFLLMGVKNMWVLLPGAFVSGWLSLICVDLITNKTKLKQDAAIAIVLSVFFAFGVVLLSYIQHHGNGNQSGLDSFLLGKAAALLASDLPFYFSVTFVVIVSILFFYRSFTFISFDVSFAKSIGMPVQLLQQVLTALTVVSIVIGIQSVGIVLMSAMLITPAAAARYWTHRLPLMMFLAVVFNLLASVTGTLLSFYYPAMPTGPWIVVTISMIAFFSFLFGSAKGLLVQRFKLIKSV
ncbi:MAG: metal ABC transporter permease [Cytophagaceae bacterium]